MSKWFLCSEHPTRKICLEICLFYRSTGRCKFRCKRAKDSLLNRLSLSKEDDLKKAIDSVAKSFLNERTYKLQENLDIVTDYMRNNMASRPELLQICKELDLDCESLSIDEMKETIRSEADKKFLKDKKVSADNLSEVLKKFLTLEYDYVIRDKDGNDVDYKGDKIDKVKKKRAVKKKKRSKKK